MLRRGIIGLFAVVVAILAGSVAVTMAQKSAPGYRTLVPLQERAKRAPDPAARTDDEDLPAPGEKVGRPHRVAPNDTGAGAGDDPMAAVDSFLSRNRKEADDSIKNLTKEAEVLRARLQKVEEALARWQAVSDALNQGAAPIANGPGPKPGPRIWRRQPAPESVPVPPQSPPVRGSRSGLESPVLGEVPDPTVPLPASEAPSTATIPPQRTGEELPPPTEPPSLPVPVPVPR
jgi:hypothetical protein